MKSEESHSEVTKIVSRKVIPRENEMEMMFLEDRFSIAHENGPTVNLVNCCPEDFRSWATNQASDISSKNFAWIIKSYCLNLKKDLTHLLSVRLEGLLETLYLRLKGTDASGVIVVLKAMEESSFCVPVKQDGVRLIFGFDRVKKMTKDIMCEIEDFQANDPYSKWGLRFWRFSLFGGQLSSMLRKRDPGTFSAEVRVRDLLQVSVEVKELDFCFVLPRGGLNQKKTLKADKCLSLTETLEWLAKKRHAFRRDQGNSFLAEGSDSTENLRILAHSASFVYKMGWSSSFVRGLEVV